MLKLGIGALGGVRDRVGSMGGAAAPASTMAPSAAKTGQMQAWLPLATGVKFEVLWS
jgi:hypothetical protein